MLSLFQRKRVATHRRHAAHLRHRNRQGAMRPESAASLLATPRRQKLLEHIWQRTSLSRRQFATLYLAPLERYAELVQQFPASENHHHAYPGGMLDHGLEIVAYALKCGSHTCCLPASRRRHKAAQAEAWTAGTAYAALLHDIGRLPSICTSSTPDGTVWHPWHGPLRKPYRFRYRKEREYRLHSAATGLLYARLLDRDIFDWLSWLSRPLGRAAVRAGRPVRARRHARRTGRAGRPGIGRPGTRRRSQQGAGGAPHAPATQIARRLALPAQEEFKLNQPRPGGRLADPGRLVAGEQDRLRQAARICCRKASTASRRATRRCSTCCRITASPAADAGWQGDLEGLVTSDAGWSHAFTFLKLSPR